MDAVTTQRLTIRNFIESDWPALQRIVRQYQASPYSVYDFAWPTSDDKLQEIARWFASGDDYLAICLKATDELIGYVALNKTQRQGEYGLGYCFGFDHHGKGYASEACRVMIDRAFSIFGAERITAGTAAANEPSCRLLSRLGLRRVSEAMASFRNDAAGKPIEFVGAMFALTRDEWDRRSPSRGS